MRALTRTILSVASVVLVAAACGVAGSTAPTADPFTGNYSGQGGGGAIPQVRALTNAFTTKHPGMSWALEDAGSDASATLVDSGDSDIGFTSRNLTDAEKAKVESLSLGAAGTGLAVSATNVVNGLTKDQLAKIFTCQITDWKDLGGAPGHIRTFIRESTSATRTVFESYVFGKTKFSYCKDVVEVNDIPATITSLQQFPTGIGMVTMSETTYTERSIKLLAVDGVASTAQNLRDGSYPIRRPLWLIWNRDATKLKPGIKAFIDFVKSPEGQQILATGTF